MRPTIPRMTLRHLMIVVACVALVISVGPQIYRCVLRSREYEWWATMHARSEARILAMLARTEDEISRCKDPVAVRDRCRRAGYSDESLSMFVRDDQHLIRRAANFRREISHHALMRERFEAASWRPWRDVPRDPPPEWEP